MLSLRMSLCELAGLLTCQRASREPADRTVTRRCAWWCSSAAAIGERPALWTQTNGPSGTVDTIAPWLVARAVSPRKPLRRHAELR
jgi:hypothetical protein